MAYSIFPDTESAGGLEIRDIAGVPIPQPEVNNAYVPPPEYIANCAISALPSNCEARIEPRQINAIVSELLSLAECWDPDGVWDCNSLQNLCAAFTAWVLANLTGVIISDTPPPDVKNSQLWWESDTGFMFLFYDDGDSQQWVQVGGHPVMDKVSIVGNGTIASPHSVGLVDCGSW